MVSNSARVVLQPGVRGALQAKYWKARHLVPFFSVVSSVRRDIVRCAAGSFATRGVGMAVLCDTRELEQRCSLAD